MTLNGDIEITCSCGRKITITPEFIGLTIWCGCGLQSFAICGVPPCGVEVGGEDGEGK